MIGPKGIGPKGFKAAIAFAIVLTAIFFLFQLSGNRSASSKSIKVLSYSSFLASWGPGPEIAKLFKEQTGIEVIYQDADDAGLLLTKLELFPSDVVLGLDWITVSEAKKKFSWKSHNVKQQVFDDPQFLAFDWAPLTFIYRKGEIDPPKNLDDILHTRFKGQISLQDPRTSAPGLLFLYWLVALKGEDGAFDFLNALRPNIRAVSPSWSTAYGLFQKSEAKLVFSYQTSPVYHWSNENDQRYQPAEISDKHIYQAELAGIPVSCQNCEGAHEFLEFLNGEVAQKILMTKNVMFSVHEKVVSSDVIGFQKLPTASLLQIEKLKELTEKRKELIERWKELKL